MGNGEIIRAARRRKGLTLTELGALCDMTPSKLSRVENDQSQLSARQMLALSEALETPFTTLAGEQSEGESASSLTVTRANGGRFLDAQSIKFEALCTEDGDTGSFFWVVEIAGNNSKKSELKAHPGLEFIFVLSGSAAIIFDDGEEIELHPGDAVKFSSMRPHGYVSRSKMAARLLMVNTLAPR